MQKRASHSTHTQPTNAHARTAKDTAKDTAKHTHTHPHTHTATQHTHEAHTQTKHTLYRTRHHLLTERQQVVRCFARLTPPPSRAAHGTAAAAAAPHNRRTQRTAARPRLPIRRGCYFEGTLSSSLLKYLPTAAAPSARRLAPACPSGEAFVPAFRGHVLREGRHSCTATKPVIR